MSRLFTQQASAAARLREIPPTLPVPAKGGPDAHRAWRKNFSKALRKQLGPFPERVDLNVEICETTDCGAYIRERVVFDSEKYMSVPAWVLSPKGLTKNERRPALLCAHGHGIGKDALVGISALTGERCPSDGSEDYQHRYPLQFVKRGYVVIAPDWRGFGERADDREWVRGGRDACNVSYLVSGYFGYHLLALQIMDGMRTIDYLVTRPDVDPKRIGCLGVSFGGTMTTYLTALDKRIKACVISGYISSLKDGIERANTCGAQYMPGLRTIGDISEVAAMIAPKPLLAEAGENDACFLVDDAQQAYDRVAAAYANLGKPDRIDIDRFDGPHEFSGRKAFDWFDRWLK